MYKHYKALPNFLTIKQSEVHGLGLFTTKDIEKDIDLGPSHYATDTELIRTPLGGFVNHSDTPNIIMKRQKGTRFFHAYTKRKIQAGEELLGKYMNVYKERNK